jgi:hypothetical protein
MSTVVQAFFKNEDKAYQNKIKLEKYDIEVMEYGPVKGDLKEGRRFILPVAGTAAPYSGNHGAQGVAAGAFGILVSKKGDQTDGEAIDPKHMQYTLSVKVEDNKAEEIIDLLKNNDGYIASDD